MNTFFDVNTTITFEQVKEFGAITGDNGPIHSVNGIVQGGLILGMLPKWLSMTADGEQFDKSGKLAVSMILDAKFRRKLPSNIPITVRFEYNTSSVKYTKINWNIKREMVEYCSGTWVIYKTPIDNK